MAITDSDRKAYYSEVQKILVEDVPLAWLVEINFPTIYSKKLRNVVTSAIGVNETFESVYIAK